MEKMPVKIGDKIKIKSSGGQYTSFAKYFDYAKKYLITQMGENMYILAKRSFELDPDFEVKRNVTYTIIGCAPRFLFEKEVEDEEILILMDDNGHIILFANEECYFDSKLYHVYPGMLKGVFGEHLILHIDDKEIEI